MTEEKPILLIVDDDEANLESYAMAFHRHPYRLLTAQGGARALEILRETPVDVVLTDMKMPEVDGLAVVDACVAMPSPPVVIVVTAYGTIETAVEVMRRGARDYVTKPVQLAELRVKVEKAFEDRALCLRTKRTERDNERLQSLLSERFKFEGVIGVSKAMHDVIEKCRMVADSKASVLIEGESGTGKELIARAIHFNSPRAKKPFVPIHCAAIPETLMEAELFGSEKGAYTGAVQQRIGHFESADKGTVFLDELGEVPPATQVKLLRVLEQREITRVGATRPASIDIRLVAATNKDLEKEVREGRFREDLFYRLNVVRIALPPLRERPEDVAPLMRHFLKELARENDRGALRMTQEAQDRLMQHTWRGNIRELRNVVEQMVIFAQSQEIGLENLPPSLRQSDTVKPTHTDGLTLEELEKRHILRTLEAMGHNRTRAAERLGISRRTMQRKLKELGLETSDASE